MSGAALRIAPSMLAANFGKLAAEARALGEAGADWLHVDVMDGHFVPNLSIGPAVVAALREATTLPLDVHLMIEAPERWVPEFARAGADRIGVHVEALEEGEALRRCLAQIRGLGARACAVLNPATPAEAVESALGELDQVLVMSVNPGFGGQGFMPEVLPKLRRLRQWIDARAPGVALEVDGGIGPATIAEAARAGADVFVAGTAILGSGDYGAAIAQLRQAAQAARAGAQAAARGAC